MDSSQVKCKLMSETTGMLGIMLINLGKQTGIWTALAGGDKYTTRRL